MVKNWFLLLQNALDVITGALIFIHLVFRQVNLLININFRLIFHAKMAIFKIIILKYVLFVLIIALNVLNLMSVQYVQMGLL